MCLGMKNKKRIMVDNVSEENPVRDLSLVERRNSIASRIPLGMQRICIHAVTSLTGCRFRPGNIFSTELSSLTGCSFRNSNLYRLNIFRALLAFSV